MNMEKIKLFEDISFEDIQTAAEVLDCIIRYGEEATRFYLEKNLISQERFDALVEITKTEMPLIKRIDAALNAKNARVGREALADIAEVYGNVLINLRKEV